MLHILSPQYDAEFDLIGRELKEIAVCSGMLKDEWKDDLLAKLAANRIATVWHDVSLSNYTLLDSAFEKGDTVWVLIDGIETDGYPGLTVISYIERLRTKYDLRVIGPRAAFYSQDKLCQKKIFMEKRINTPAYFLPADEAEASECFAFLFKDRTSPYIIKPYNLYCSIGIEPDSAVTGEKDALHVYHRLRAKTGNILIEQFIKGREFTVVCIGNARGIKVYPPAERAFVSADDGMGFMDFAMTQVLHGDHATLEMKTVTDPELVRKIEDLSRAAFRAVEAEAYVRIDIRMDTKTGLLYVLEVNPCPSVGVESSIEEILLLNTISFGTFFNDLIQYGVWADPVSAASADRDFFGNGTAILNYDPGKGRYIRTGRRVRKGEPIFTVDIEAFGVEEIYKKNYCHHCLSYSPEPYSIVCEDCGQVYYCSDECRTHDTNHQHECLPLKKFYQHHDGPVESITYYRTDINVLSLLLSGAENLITILVTNYDKTDSAKRIEAWKIAFRLEEFFEYRISLSNILATVCSTDCNCFSSDVEPDGITLLSAKFAMLEHNCIPNAARHVDGRKVTVYALKDIPEDNPVAINYISALYHRNVRRQNLAEYYYFQCGCSLCRSGKDELSPEELEDFNEKYSPQTPGSVPSSSCFSFLNGRIVEHRADENGDYPSVLKDTSYGRGLFAAEDLPENCGVQKFAGRIMPYAQVPEEEKAYALLLRNDEWLVSETDARYVNHSCEPNCKIGPHCEIRTIRPVRKGEELTISYNRVSRQEYDASPDFFFWDSKWSFSCRCGSSRCAGKIDRYIIVD